MRAWRYAAFGPINSALRLEDIPVPQPGAHDVLVRAEFVGINPLDWKLVEGQFKWLAKSRPPRFTNSLMLPPDASRSTELASHVAPSQSATTMS